MVLWTYRPVVSQACGLAVRFFLPYTHCGMLGDVVIIQGIGLSYIKASPSYKSESCLAGFRRRAREDSKQEDTGYVERGELANFCLQHRRDHNVRRFHLNFL